MCIKKTFSEFLLRFFAAVDDHFVWLQTFWLLQDSNTFLSDIFEIVSDSCQSAIGHWLMGRQSISLRTIWHINLRRVFVFARACVRVCVCVCVSVCQCATLSFIDLNSVRMAMLAAITLVSSVSLEDSYGAKKNSVSELTITMLQIMEETWLLRRRYVAICIRNIRISWKIRSWYCHALERWVNIIKHFQYHSCCFCQLPSLDCYVNKWSCQEWSW